MQFEIIAAQAGDATLTIGTIALFGAVLGPVVGALIHVHRKLMEGEADKLQKAMELSEDRYNDMKSDRDFYRKQAEEKDIAQLEAILALKEGIVAVRGVANDINTLKTQINIVTDKIQILTDKMDRAVSGNRS
jgi:hypothetical protein